MLVKKMKAEIGKDKKLILHLPDTLSGEVEVIILTKKKGETIRKLPGGFYSPLKVDSYDRIAKRNEIYER
ncbi:MAG: hypothetical protein KAW82_00470 [Desulfurellaceae bacterium]|nr:hypothetical protein [Desulfurellaceae bacterium]